MPDGVYPEVGRARHGSPGADEEDVDVGRHASRGRSSCWTRRTRSRKNQAAVTDSGARCATTPREGGDLEPDRAHDRRDGRDDREARGPLRRRRATAPSRTESPRRSSSCSSRSRRATRSSAATRASSSGCSHGAAKARAASAPTLEAMYERMGFVRPGWDLRGSRRSPRADRRRRGSPLRRRDAVAIFIVSGAALAGLAWLIAIATESVGQRFGPAATGVLQSTLGNLPELFIVMFASRGRARRRADVILGSLLANALLVSGSRSSRVPALPTTTSCASGSACLTTPRRCCSWPSS